MQADDQTLPSFVLDWLGQNGYQVNRVKRLIGGYAATLYRLSVSARDAKTCSLIYKHLTADRRQELTLYDQVLYGRSDLIPRVLACFREADSAGILMVDEGPTLKAWCQTLSRAPRQRKLEDAVRWLADLHIRCEAWLPELVGRGLQSTYPVSSAVTWAGYAIVALQGLSADETCDFVSEAQVQEIVRMSDWFYERYPHWLAGRTTLTHGDAHHGNIVCTENAFLLIDWEATCVAVPQRDLAIFLQDVLDATVHEAVKRAYFEHLRAAGWETTSHAFAQSFEAVFFDNTLMMLGWEIQQYHKGYLTRVEIAEITRVKMSWLATSFAQLQDGTLE